VNIRRATPADVSALLAIKHELRFSGSGRGGFLLGADEQGYQRCVRDGEAWVLDLNGDVAGFAITMGAAAFAKTPLWELRHHVKWSATTDAMLSQGVGYFDQLAVKRGTPARATTLLAFAALFDLLNTDRYVVTTTVVAPVCNNAAVPLIQLVGGVRVGELEEVYESFGPLTSCVWLLSAADANQRVQRALNTPKPTVLSALARAATRRGLAHHAQAT
jgi:hypothetical protein